MFGQKQKEIERLRKLIAADAEHCERLAESRKDLLNALERQEDISKALADENRDLTRQLELLRALLKQLRVNVTLPARLK